MFMQALLIIFYNIQPDFSWTVQADIEILVLNEGTYVSLGEIKKTPQQWGSKPTTSWSLGGHPIYYARRPSKLSSKTCNIDKLKKIVGTARARVLIFGM
ncbi:hypothetical protein DPMN_118366 [Dreissena polymorpha]|uniref:Uncharacterized protein n=1 Tax=Dreissena polymorpha TaxID=45954 RepID=A0A9D4JQ63_DREPO|nr:hypothetical protein DPMN_118366 [Dreissena polymorpha]